MKKILLAVCVFCLFAAPALAVDIEEVTGEKTGIKAWLVEDHKLPIVSLSFAFQGGSEQDPVDKQGLATLTAGALTEGAGNYSAEAFQRELSDYSITLGFAAERDEIGGGVKCLSADRARAFDLLRLALTRPRFEPEDVERLRARQIAAMRAQFSDPDWQARYALLSHIFAGHPYSERRLGTTATLNAITRADVQDFAARHFARNNVTVAAAGDISPRELAEAIDRIFADLPARAQLAAIAEVEEVAATSILVRRDGTQTEMMFAMPGPKRDDPDYYAAEIANYILGGGGFSSRLMQEVRDKKGLTYGIASGLAPSQHAGMVFVHASVDNPKAGEAYDLIRDTMRRFRDEGATLREIAAAKDYLTGSQPLALTSTDKIASVLVAMQREDLGRDYLDRYASIIRSVSAQDVARAMARFFAPERMTAVFVGKPDGLTAVQIKDTVKQ